MERLAEYQTPGDLLDAFGDAFQRGFTQRSARLDEVMLDVSLPTLNDVMETFTFETAIFWLKKRFESFTEMWAPSRERNDRLLTQLAEIIFAEGRQLNLGEVCLFIAWLTSGKMGNLYDASPVRIACCFQTFLQQRASLKSSIIMEREMREYQQRLEDERNQRCSPEYLQDMVEYWTGRGDEEMARIFRTRLALVKGGAL